MVHYEKFERSLNRLQDQNLYYQQLDSSLPSNLQEAVVESVIQRFETCFDTLWKVLRRYLIDGLGLSDVPNSPKPILRLAAENYLLVRPVEDWFEYANARVDTAHDYDVEKAKACLELIPGFIEDAVNLYETLSGNRWEQSKQ